MRSNYQKYDLSSKTKLVEEFTEQEITEGISARKYAANNGIAYSTFKRWLAQYRQYMAEKKEETSVAVQETSGFIMISEEESAVSALPEPEQGIRLRYKDAVLEFEVSQLEQVMEILKRW